jgi:hypothetical protein
MNDYSTPLRILRTFLAVTAIAMGIAASAAPGPGPRPVLDPLSFGAHVHRSVPNSLWKQVGFGSIRLHDANVTWAELQPARNRWHWDHLDQIVANARSAGVDILLPLNATPTWAASRPQSADAYGLGSASPPVQLADWDTYVAAVTERYKGKIAGYEIWNEPNLKEFFSGTPNEMAELTRRASVIIRKNDPAAKVVCASITGSYGIPWLKQYLQTGTGNYCDVIGYHFYTKHQAPEIMIETIQTVRKVMVSTGLSHKPLWNTETGWIISTGKEVVKVFGVSTDAIILSQDEATAYIPRALLLSKFFGVDRFYWYSWDHPSMGISAGRGIGWTRSSRLYSEFVKFISGATIESCSNMKPRWSCTLRTKSGLSVTALWSEAGLQSTRAPMTGEIFTISKLGEIVASGHIATEDTIKISGEPIFIRETR